MNLAVAHIDQIKLTDPTYKIKGVGPKLADKLNKLKINNILDLYFHWPKKIVDLTNPKQFKELKIGEKAVIAGRIRDIKLDLRKGTRRKNTVANIYNELGEAISITWFNQGYLANILKYNQYVLIYGIVRWDFKKKQKTFWNPQIETQQGIIPIYPETKGLNSKFINKIITNLDFGFTWPEIIEAQKLNLPDFSESIRQIHTPDTQEKWLLARERLKLNELVCLFYYLKKEERKLLELRAPKISADPKILQRFVDALPFKLTPSQKKAGWAIIQSHNSVTPSNRLLLGDVGTGKTVVAALSAIPSLRADKKVLWLVPTQVLANQLHARLQDLLMPLKIKPELVIAGTKPNKNAQLFIGTHAIINLNFNPQELGFIIIDEQHRFGVKQRDFMNKENSGFCPHILTMTATPIPRTLAMSVWGDQKLSILKDRPSLQHPVQTFLVRNRNKIKKTLIEQISQGRQAFIVAPRIKGVDKNSQDEDRKSLDNLQNIYKKLLPKARICIYHGKQEVTQQNNIMDKFLNGEIDILLATSIIEVGIDVPNATVMIIEDAHWFGLAQLHQIRGRIGRGQYPGMCYVLGSEEEEYESERLKYFASTNDGAKLAELDLKLRGPGDLLGENQSGMPPMKLADFSNPTLIEVAKNISSNLLDNPSKNLEDFLNLYR